MNPHRKFDDLRKKVAKLTNLLKKALQVIPVKKNTLRKNQEHSKEKHVLSRQFTYQVQVVPYTFAL